MVPKLPFRVSPGLLLQCCYVGGWLSAFGFWPGAAAVVRSFVRSFVPAHRLSQAGSTAQVRQHSTAGWFGIMLWWNDEEWGGSSVCSFLGVVGSRLPRGVVLLLQWDMMHHLGFPSAQWDGA